jgi:hypothetical protein
MAASNNGDHRHYCSGESSDQSNCLLSLFSTRRATLDITGEVSRM